MAPLRDIASGCGKPEAYRGPAIERAPLPPRRKENGFTYTFAESTTRTDEETGTNGTTNGNHVQVARLHGAVKFDNTVTVDLALE